MIVERWSGAGEFDLRALATAIVATNPDIVVTEGARSVAALLEATSSIPIVATAGFTGLVASIAVLAAT